MRWKVSFKGTYLYHVYGEDLDAAYDEARKIARRQPYKEEVAAELFCQPVQP